MAGILTTAQQAEAWHDFVDAAFPTGPGQAPLPFNATDLVAAVQAVDAWVTANAASYNAALPAPFQGTANAAQKAALLAYVVMRRFTG